MGRDANTPKLPGCETGGWRERLYIARLPSITMNEYWLMLIVVCLGAAIAWAFFRQLAKLAIWSVRPKLDALRFGLITFCLAIVIGDTIELWEAALLGAVSLVAYRAIRRDRTRFESAMVELSNHAIRFLEQQMQVTVCDREKVECLRLLAYTTSSMTSHP